MLKVSLLERPSDYLKNVYIAARRCKGVDTDQASKEYADKPDKAKALIVKLLQDNELSPFEHGLFTFDISGISRACSHQIVRHRIASYCQQSQRYTKISDAVIPDAIMKDEESYLVFCGLLEQIDAAYEHLSRRTNLDAARYIAPIASKTSLIASFNGRSLMNFLSQRLCRCASDEIREVAKQMLIAMFELYPELFTTENVMACKHCKQKCLKKYSHKAIFDTVYLK